jgi:hypothetical protein
MIRKQSTKLSSAALGGVKRLDLRWILLEAFAEFRFVKIRSDVTNKIPFFIISLLR